MVITENDNPGVEAVHLMRQQERGGPPVYRDRNGNWLQLQVITEEE